MTTTESHEPPRSALHHQLRELHDAQSRTLGLASETLQTVLPLTQLLTLLNRPEDQAQDLGRQLSEALKSIALNLNAVHQAVERAHQEQQHIGRRLEQRLTQDREALVWEIGSLRAAVGRCEIAATTLKGALLEDRTD